MRIADARSDVVSGNNPSKNGATRRRVPCEHHSVSRTALRNATQVIHQRMHHHPGLARLAAGTIGRNEYCRLLARSYGFYAVVEPFVGLPGKFTECLIRDLIELGMAAAAVSALPRCAHLMIGDGHSELIGARYVLLGASLGGKVMAKAIARHDGGNVALPIRFLTCSGENDWKGFVAELEATLPDADSRSRAAVAANATFAAFEDWMIFDE